MKNYDPDLAWAYHRGREGDGYYASDCPFDAWDQVLAWKAGVVSKQWHACLGSIYWAPRGEALLINGKRVTEANVDEGRWV